MKKRSALLSGVLVSLAGAAYAIPSYSDQSGISSTLTQLMDWLAYGIGPGCVVIAICVFAYRLMSNDKEAWAHSKNLIIGALVLELAAGIGKALMGIAQVNQ